MLGALIAALLVRLLALLLIYVTTDPSHEDFNALFGDGRFSIERSLWILNDWKGVPIGPWYRLGIFAPYGGIAFDRVLALVQWFLGPSPYGLTLINVAAFMAGAVLLYRAARPAFGPRAAGGGLIVLLFWPTFVVWSISMLKESVLFFLPAAALAAAVRLPFMRRRLPQVAVAVLILVLAKLTGSNRTGNDLMVVGAALCGYAAYVTARRPAVGLALAALVLAGSAVALRQPAIQTVLLSRIGDALHYHVGHVKTPGKAYRAADAKFYAQWPAIKLATITAGEGTRFLIRSAAMFVLAPLPSQVVSASEVLFLPQQFAWYALVLLAVVGVWVGLSRHAVMTATLAGYCVLGMAIIAPNSGNIGTLIRHRDMIVPFMVWLGALGADAVLQMICRKPYASC